MNLRLYRCNMLFALVTWLFIAVAGALHADEAGIIDWHHQLIGTPLEGSTFLHKPVAVSGALAFTLTGKNVLAALNPRDGGIVWRQLLDDPKLIRPVDGHIAVLSGKDTTVVTIFDAQTGHQSDQSSQLAGSPLDMEILSPDWPEDDTRDIVTLSSGGLIRRFHHQKLVWESHSSNIKGEARYIATSLSKIYVVFTVPHAKSSSITVATLDAVTGNIIDTHALDASLVLDTDLQVIGSHSSAPLAVWNEKGKIKANLLGSKSIIPLTTERPFTSFTALAPHSSTSLPHFLISFTDSTSSWGQVYHVNLQKGNIEAAYSLPKSPRGIYSLAQVDANIYFGKVTIEQDREEADFEVWGSNSHARLGRWSIPFPSHYGLPEFGVLDVVAKGDSVAARAVITTEDGGIHLLRNNEHSWTHEESLSHIIPEHTLFLDLPVPEPKVQLNVSTGNLISAYLTRVTTHIKQLKDLPQGLTTFARHFATGRYEEIELGSTNRDAFGFRKFIIVATKQGTLLALDSANKGNIVWRLNLGGEILGTWTLRESSTVRGHPPVVGVIVANRNDGRDGEFVLVNGLNGATTGKEPANLEVPNIVKAFQVPAGLVDGLGRRPVIVIPRTGTARILPETAEAKSLLARLGDTLYYSVRESDAVQGYFFDAETLSGVPTWRFQIPTGTHLVSLTSRPPAEKVASIGRVLGDRSVLYKYLNPHLLVLAVTDPLHAQFTLYLLDNVSGQILHELKHRSVDTSKGVKTHVVENVVYWSYFSIGEAPGQSRGGRITVAELYESREKNQRFNESEWSSFNENFPRVIAQTYLFDHAVKDLTSTTTRHGITSRDLLVATTNQLISLPKRLLDPRRPVIPAGGKLKGDDKEEGLVAYDAAIPDERKWTISHVNELFGITEVKTSPALLESTSLVLGMGLDLFFTRVAPSGTFDVLSEGFSKSQLLATISALLAGLIVLRPLVRRKLLKQRWGEQT